MTFCVCIIPILTGKVMIISCLYLCVCVGILVDKIIECREFEEKNSRTYEQVVTDNVRIGKDIADITR